MWWKWVFFLSFVNAIAYLIYLFIFPCWWCCCRRNVRCCVMDIGHALNWLRTGYPFEGISDFFALLHYLSFSMYLHQWFDLYINIYCKLLFRVFNPFAKSTHTLIYHTHMPVTANPLQIIRASFVGTVSDIFKSTATALMTSL